MADETLVGDTWLYTTLNADATLTGEITGVYADQAPQSATLPYVIFEWMAGSDIMYVNGVRVWHSGVWIVKAVGSDRTSPSTGTWAALDPAASRIETLLHRQSGTGAGGTVFTCTREAPFRNAYSDEGVAYRELGGRFRIEVQS